MSILNKDTKPVTFDGAAQEAKAASVAAVIGHSLDNDLAVLTKAKADYEGGPFVVLFNLDKHLKPEHWAAMPDHEAETGNNPRFYKTRKVKADGKEKLTDRDYYKVIADNLPDVIEKEKRIELLGRSMKDPTKFNLSDVPQEIKDMLPHRRHAEIAKLGRAITTARNNVVAALELFSQMQRVSSLNGVTLDLLYALNDKGQELDGTDAVGNVRKIDDTRAPILLTTKLERRKAIDTGRFSVSSFMRFNIPVAVEQGGSWDALMATVKKGTKEKDKDGASNPKLIRTPDTAAQVMTDFADYLTYCQDDKTKAAWEAFTKTLHGPGSDDAFYNASMIYASLELAVGSPKDKVRFQALFTDREKAAA